MNLYTRHIATPFGDMILAVDDANILTRLVFPNEHERWAQEILNRAYTVNSEPARSDLVAKQLDDYFQGKRRTFDLPLNPIGTPFQQKVWAALTTIPYGTTISYKQLAERINNLAAIRAVGRANGSNPIPIIIPCHRVIGADGSLIGFGGGLPLKESLLELEGVQRGQRAARYRQPALL